MTVRPERPSVPFLPLRAFLPGGAFGKPRRTGVLVVDDEPMVRNLVTLLLRRNGCVAWQAHDGKHAVELYPELQSDIDLVLLDKLMPGLDGY